LKLLSRKSCNLFYRFPNHVESLFDGKVWFDLARGCKMFAKVLPSLKQHEAQSSDNIFISTGSAFLPPEHDVFESNRKISYVNHHANIFLVNTIPNSQIVATMIGTSAGD
jgi:hypothetical protein